MSTWIVVAHLGGARLVDERDDKLRVFETIDFHERERESHPGDTGEQPRESARTLAANVFAGQLAERLEKGRNAHAYKELVLIAPPRFLGALRRALHNTTASMVRGTLDKDFGGLGDRDLLLRLEKL